MNSASANLFLASCLALTLMTADATMLGGWENLTDDQLEAPDLKASVEAAAAKYNTEYAGTDDNAKACVLHMTNAQSQVVSGVNYKFTLSMGPCKRLVGEHHIQRACEFVVWYQAWNSPNPVRSVTINQCSILDQYV